MPAMVTVMAELGAMEIVHASPMPRMGGGWESSVRYVNQATSAPHAIESALVSPQRVSYVQVEELVQMDSLEMGHVRVKLTIEARLVIYLVRRILLDSFAPIGESVCRTPPPRAYVYAPPVTTAAPPATSAPPITMEYRVSRAIVANMEFVMMVLPRMVPACAHTDTLVSSVTKSAMAVHYRPVVATVAVVSVQAVALVTTRRGCTPVAIAHSVPWGTRVGSVTSHAL